MHQEIFQMGLAVETVSLYLMCCGTVPEGQPVQRQQLAATWTGGQAELDTALEELVGLGIMEPVPPAGETETPRYRITPPSRWRRAD